MSGFLRSQPITLAFHVILKHNFIILFLINFSILTNLWYIVWIIQTRYWIGAPDCTGWSGGPCPVRWLWFQPNLQFPVIGWHKISNLYLFESDGWFPRSHRAYSNHRLISKSRWSKTSRPQVYPFCIGLGQKLIQRLIIIFYLWSNNFICICIKKSWILFHILFRFI